MWSNSPLQKTLQKTKNKGFLWLKKTALYKKFTRKKIIRRREIATFFQVSWSLCEKRENSKIIFLNKNNLRGKKCAKEISWKKNLIKEKKMIKE